MFEYFDMASNYEDRKIDRYDGNGFTVDTAWVNDTQPPYETAVKHDKFGGKWIPVQHYETKELAQIGHDEWVRKLKNDEVDCLKEELPDSFAGLVKPTIAVKSSTTISPQK